MFCIGEVFNGNAAYVSSFQLNGTPLSPSGALDSVLNYPMYAKLLKHPTLYLCSCNMLCMYYGILQAFGLKSGCSSGMTCLSPYISPTATPALYPQPALLGTFIDNHDNSRFLNISGATVTLYKNALAVVLLSRGIPIIYYGTEQGFSGGDNGILSAFSGYCGQREVMWPHYDTSAPLYAFITRVVAARKLFGIAGPALDQRECWADTNVYAFARGGTLIAVTNTMSAQLNLPSSSNPFPANSRACDFMSDRAQNPNPCVESQPNGGFDLTLTGGKFALYVPARALNAQLSLSSATPGAAAVTATVTFVSASGLCCGDNVTLAFSPGPSLPCAPSNFSILTSKNAATAALSPARVECVANRFTVAFTCSSGCPVSSGDTVRVLITGWQNPPGPQAATSVAVTSGLDIIESAAALGPVYTSPPPPPAPPSADNSPSSGPSPLSAGVVAASVVGSLAGNFRFPSMTRC